MKKCNSGLLLVALFAAGAVWAAETTALTRAQWLKKIGESVTQESVLRETVLQVSPEERVEFTQRVLKAVTRLPVSPDEKAAAFVRAAVACIAGATGEVKYKVIAEVFAGVPVEFLPLVTEELAKRFDQEYNKLTDAQYEVIAVAAVSAAVIRNAQTDEPSVRNTFVILAFLRGAKSPELEAKLLALLPDDRMRGLVASWLPAALKDRNYDGLLAAADVEALALSSATVMRLIGHTTLDRLLAQMYFGAPLSTVWGYTQGSSQTTGFRESWDYGIDRLPRPTGYQDQSTSIETRETIEGSCDACSICIRDLFR
jgi:hypothetical protein